ncbi:MAG: DUF192 domain-containing protein [Myxococcota bacterium]
MRHCALVLVFALVAACGNGAPPPIDGSELPVEWLRIGTHRISAEIARTPAERNRGLMFRESLPTDHGMLFVFQDDRVRGFWMRNTPLPLTIAYADAAGRIVHIADLEPHVETPVSSRYPARYALEMRRDWFRDHAVFPGDRIEGIPKSSPSGS